MQETQLTGPIFRNAAQIMFLSKSSESCPLVALH